MPDVPVNPFEFEPVGEPEHKTDQMVSYWVYPITFRTVLDQYPVKEMTVKRRFNDFFHLREALVDAHPGVIVPPVPEKSTAASLEKVGVPVETKDLQEFRKRAFFKFLVRVGAHPILCTSPLLQDFLTLAEEQYRKKKESSSTAPSGSTSGVSAAASTDAGGSASKPTISQRFKEIKYSMSTKGGGSESPGGDDADESSGACTAKEYDDTAMYVKKLEETLAALRDRLITLVAFRRDHSDHLKTFGRAMTRLGEHEDDSRRGKVDVTPEKRPLVATMGLANAAPRLLVQAGNAAEAVSLTYSQHGYQETMHVVETLKYYIGMCTAVRHCVDVLKRMLLTRDTLRHEKAAFDERLRTAAGETAKLEAEQQDVGRKLQHAEKTLNDCAETFRDEFVRFHREKQYDMKAMLKMFVEIQTDAAERIAGAWRALPMGGPPDTGSAAADSS
eukprot:TRINITY_DN57052_c0_g1_i1.p1 TRINITY_DN57052_c0_g1~~TRINITY_DN57052_c0_g1_i1.p1  ORF type:complete len:445 (-),score=118.83 TRINITY_DN57052_c0_g1_i1:201-1535(-)